MAESNTINVENIVFIICLSEWKVQEVQEGCAAKLDSIL